MELLHLLYYFIPQLDCADYTSNDKSERSHTSQVDMSDFLDL